MTFSVQILGANSALAAHGRHPSSQLLRLENRSFLIDCGEGTQMQLQKFKCKPFKIEHILISHLHGDHYFGLIGLLTTYHLLQRKNTLYVYGPPALEKIIQFQLEVANTVLSYPLIFRATQAERDEIIFEDDFISIQTIPLKHRIPCTGFIFREKRFPRKINSEKIIGLELSHEMYTDLRKGLNITDANGVFHANEQLTLPGSTPKSYAYCTDTLFYPEIVEYIKEVDLLYHEATFMEEHEERALQTFHSTSKQAAKIAVLANAKQLLLGHFSSKYPSLKPILSEALEVFSDTILAEEGIVINIGEH